MKQSFKYGLSNAHILLSKIKQDQSNTKTKNSIEQKEESREAPLNNSSNSEKNFNDRFQAQFEKPNGKVTLSEMIINKHLEQIQVKYSRDLEQMLQNRDNLLNAIEILTQKMLFIKELETKNRNYQKVIDKKKQSLIDVALQYQKTNQQLYMTKISMKQQYKKICLSLKSLMLQCQSDRRFEKFCDQWDYYCKALQQNHQLAQNSQVMLNHDKIMLIFKEKQQAKAKIKDQQVILTKKPSKKADLSQKAELLGNLKQFSKKFKIP